VVAGKSQCAPGSVVVVDVVDVWTVVDVSWVVVEWSVIVLVVLAL